jgi:hypothetical protein
MRIPSNDMPFIDDEMDLHTFGVLMLVPTAQRLPDDFSTWNMCQCNADGEIRS